MPDEAATLVRALLTADKNQFTPAPAMTEAQRSATPEVDFRPFIIADADTGHGGDAHVRNLIRRFVEVGVPGYHIEDQKPGVKKCGHQGGKVLVSEDEQIKRLNAARFQLDIMQVPGIIVARTDAESANLLDGRERRARPALHPRRHQPRRADLQGGLARDPARASRAGHRGADRPPALRHLRRGEYAAADVWLERAGLSALLVEAAADYWQGEGGRRGAPVTGCSTGSSTSGRPRPGVKTYGEAVADVMASAMSEGVQFRP